MEKPSKRFPAAFRTLHGAKVFARIRSYISTCRKRGRNILEENCKRLSSANLHAFGLSRRSMKLALFSSAAVPHRSMAKAKQDKRRQKRIEQEIVVDANGPEEQAMGWY